MSFKLIDNHLSPAEGEIVVRTYHCTNISPVFALIGLKTDGYLTVTNKRLVYFAEGSSVFGIAGNSKLYKEVTISDVANLSLNKGTRFSFLRLLCGLIVGQIPAVVITLLMFGLMLALGAVGEGGNPYLLRLCVFAQLSVAILLVFCSFSVSRDSIIRLMLAACGALLVLAVPGFALAQKGKELPPIPSAYFTVLMVVGVPLVCYWIWCLYWFFRREYLIMSIRSKSNWPATIDIKGVSWWGGINIAADIAYGMSPGVDADAMFKELGAMVTDIQTLGDHGIQKWVQVEKDSAQEKASKGKELSAHRFIQIRYAMAAIIAVAILISSESVWYASGAKYRQATQMRGDLAEVRNNVENDAIIKKWVPKLLVTAKKSTDAGEAAYQGGKYTDAIAHWKLAMNTYSNSPSVATAMENASLVQARYSSNWSKVYYQESVSERLNPSSMLGSFTALIDQHPIPNQPWKTVRKNIAEAKELDVLTVWTSVASAWGNASSSVPRAYQLMHADILVQQAENEIKMNNPSGAVENADSALRMVSDYAPAVQRKDLASNIIKYNQWLQSDIAKELNIPAADDWQPINVMAEKAHSLANNDKWEESNDEWKNALSKIPSVILALRLEKLETDARRGNWAAVSRLARTILHDYPDHLRASELRKKADGILSAYAAEMAYQKVMADVLAREVNDNYIKTGNLSDLMAHMDKYGFDEWSQVKEAVSKAEAFGLNEQGAESLKEWNSAIKAFPAAINRMRAEIWMEQAESAYKGTNWINTLIYAEQALKQKPDHGRAKELRDQADIIVKKNLQPTK